MLVPLTYDRPDETAITLALARRPASNPGTAAGSLVINPGGPGGSGIAFLRGFDLSGLDRYDLVGWDPRGAGASTPVRCWPPAQMDAYVAVDTTPDNKAEQQGLVDADRRFGLSCLAGSGSLLEHVSSVESVRDLDLVRSALGQSKISFLGYSNGSLLGAEYAQLFPSHVNRMVLDGAVNISGSSVSQARGFDRALGQLADWCVRQRCGLGTSREAVLSAITSLWDRLDSRPMTSGGRELTQSLGVGGVLEALYLGEPGWASIVKALELAIKSRDPDAMLAWADAFTGRQRDGSYDEIAYAFPASECLDTSDESLRHAMAESKRQNAQAPTLGRYFGEDVLCSLWPVRSAPALGKLTAPKAPPLLVIGTKGDPATPYEWARGMARRLKSAILVTNRGSGHTSYHNRACVEGVVVPYLADGVLPKTGTTC